eukprot:1179569-Prorocentrum_minimum.AAC.2
MQTFWYRKLLLQQRSALTKLEEEVKGINSGGGGRTPKSSSTLSSTSARCAPELSRLVCQENIPAIPASDWSAVRVYLKSVL